MSKQQSELEKLKNRKVSLAPNKALETALKEKTQGNEAGSVLQGGEEPEKSPESPSNSSQDERSEISEGFTPKGGTDVPVRFRKLMQANEELGQLPKANVQTYEYLITEFNHLRNYAKAKKQKTSVSAMISNILHDYLVKNAPELEKVFGYRPFKNS